jgi:phosphate/sulfate permease
MAKTFDFEMFRYTPSLVGAIIAIIIYSILAGLHFWQWFQTRQVIILCVVLGALGQYFAIFTFDLPSFNSLCTNTFNNR